MFLLKIWKGYIWNSYLFDSTHPYSADPATGLIMHCYCCCSCDGTLKIRGSYSNRSYRAMQSLQSTLKVPSKVPQLVVTTVVLCCIIKYYVAS